MATFKLNADTWDIDFTDTGDIDILEGAQETTQNSRFRLQIIAGEMFDDTRKGVPWMTDMVSPAVSIAAKKNILQRVILSTPGAVRLTSMNMSVGREGLATSTWEGICESGETFSNTVAPVDEKDKEIPELIIDAERIVAAARAWELSSIYYSDVLGA